MESPIERYFPELPEAARDRLGAFETRFRSWNARVNLVSRKDMEAFVLHHLVHSLVLTKWLQVPAECRLLDVGTGGGLPGLPLAIAWPQARLFLCDSIGKKARAVEDMVRGLGLHNAVVVHKRAETLESKWDYILGRAVASLPRFLGWIRDNLRTGSTGSLANGVLYWKGSLYKDELEPLGIAPDAVFPIGEAVPEPYFQDKYIIHLSRETVLRARLAEPEP